jgi:hypothetical protein
LSNFNKKRKPSGENKAIFFSNGMGPFCPAVKTFLLFFNSKDSQKLFNMALKTLFVTSTKDHPILRHFCQIVNSFKVYFFEDY